MSAAPFSAFTLTPNQLYRVVVAFTDYDRTIHPVGERWRYLRKNFLPYDAGLTLYVEADGKENLLRLQCYEDAQNAIVDHFSDFVVVDELPLLA